LSPEAFPFGTFQSLDLHCLVNVRAHRITYVGELGYELYIPTESTQLVYDALHAAAAATATATATATSGDTSDATSGTTSDATSGATSEDSSVSVTRGPIGLRNGGYFAIDSLRLEKGYRAWGHDITPNETPLEAGLGFTIDWNKDYAFIGREALWKQKQEGVQKKLVSVIIEEPIGHSSSPSSSPSSSASSSSPSGNAPAGYAYGGEPLYRDGILVGYLTSAGYGYSLQKSIGLAYVSSKNLPTSEGKPVVVDLKFLRQGSYEIELADGRYRCRVTTKPPYDPSGNKIFC
jgi:glycine cleavage system aminomethyltransferase T